MRNEVELPSPLRNTYCPIEQNFTTSTGHTKCAQFSWCLHRLAQMAFGIHINAPHFPENPTTLNMSGN